MTVYKLPYHLTKILNPSWIRFIFDGNVPAVIPTKRFNVCANHFTKDDFLNLLKGPMTSKIHFLQFYVILCVPWPQLHPKNFISQHAVVSESSGITPLWITPLWITPRNIWITLREGLCLALYSAPPPLVSSPPEQTQSCLHLTLAKTFALA